MLHGRESVMSITQVSVFLENKSGRLLDVTGVLKDSHVDIRAISLSDNVDYGILRMIVDDPARAIGVLRDAKITARTTEVLAVVIDNSPGTLHDLLAVLIGKSVNVEYMYVTASREPDRVVVILSVDSVAGAISAFETAGITRASLGDLK
jgi:hypothetical protein